MAKGGSKGVIREFTSTRGLVRLAIIVGVGAYSINWLQKRAQDASKKDSIPNKVAGALGFTGAGVAA